MHTEWDQRGEEKTSKCLIIFYLRERKSLIIIAVEWWRLLFSRIRGRCEYEVYSGSWLVIGTASASAAWLAPWPSSPAPSVPQRLRTFGVSAPRCPRVRVHSGKPNTVSVSSVSAIIAIVSIAPSVVGR